MKFQSRDTAGEDNDSSADGNNDSIQERYMERSADSVSWSPESASKVIFEDRVGKFGKIQRLSNSTQVAHHDPSLRSLVLSPTVATTGSKNCADVDLSNLEGPAQVAEVPRYAIIFDVDVLKELVKPFAESLHVKIQGSTKETLADKNILVEYIHYQTSVKRQDVEMDAVSSQARASLEGKTDCDGSASVDADSEHDQAKLNLIAKKEAKIDAKRLAEEEQRNSGRKQPELRELAHCVSTGSSPGGYLRRRKLKKVVRFLKNPFRVFRAHKNKHGGFSTDTALASMRNASQQSISRLNIQFAKVDSTQRDVTTWTREEYLRKNGRIPDRSNDTKDDEQIGGVLGNNTLNQFLDDGMAGGVVSDHDSDSD